jgi:hypothetical protein
MLPVHTLLPYLPKIHSHLRLGLPSGLSLSGFPTKTLYACRISPMRAICPVRFTPGESQLYPLESPKSVWTRPAWHDIICSVWTPSWRHISLISSVSAGQLLVIVIHSWGCVVSAGCTKFLTMQLYSFAGYGAAVCGTSTAQ